MDENLHGILHGTKWIMFHSPLGIALHPSKRDGSNAKPGEVEASKLPLAPRHINCHDEVLDYLLFLIILEI